MMTIIDKYVVVKRHAYRQKSTGNYYPERKYTVNDFNGIASDHAYIFERDYVTQTVTGKAGTRYTFLRK